ncbi:hypothetical protein OESDEN_16461 [Oesophagostomum dentatum]|uniref:Uncharacterized protein n=1 Tax=Oesophagostomum dentatum TaxID=61180 RepID=A0A0B1SKT9_OESDE|nr:hypothetical protein OESDEN_16461 [Oesophagostomum dentatum]
MSLLALLLLVVSVPEVTPQPAVSTKLLIRHKPAITYVIPEIGGYIPEIPHQIPGVHVKPIIQEPKIEVGQYPEMEEHTPKVETPLLLKLIYKIPGGLEQDFWAKCGHRIDKCLIGIPGGIMVDEPRPIVPEADPEMTGHIPHLDRDTQGIDDSTFVINEYLPETLEHFAVDEPVPKESGHTSETEEMIPGLSGRVREVGQSKREILRFTPKRRYTRGLEKVH